MMVVVCGSWQLCVGHGGCVSVWVNGGDVAVVCGSWRLCVGHDGCVWVMVVVCGSWRLCVGRGGCVCELREVSKDAIICQRLQTSKANLGTVHYNSYCIP